MFLKIMIFQAWVPLLTIKGYHLCYLFVILKTKWAAILASIMHDSLKLRIKLYYTFSKKINKNNGGWPKENTWIG